MIKNERGSRESSYEGDNCRKRGKKIRLIAKKVVQGCRGGERRSDRGQDFEEALVFSLFVSDLR